jgi:hypothetical protein
MKTILFLAVSVVAGLWWALEHSTTAELRLQIEAQREENRELETLRRERERLRALQPDPTELARLRNELSETARRQRELELEQATKKTARPPVTELTVGETLPPSAWQNRGSATPLSTVETMLWAAAGGDIATLQRLVEFDATARAKATELFARLPESSRALYATAENLVAALTAKAIPIGDAQLVWQHQHGPDDAIACLWVDNPEAAKTISSNSEAKRDANSPPTAPANHARGRAFLQLHRTDDGWRVVVPAHAMNTLAKELLGAGK